MNTKLYALVLEDVQKDAELLQEMLSDEGFELKMDVVETEKDYVTNLERNNYDIIYADFTLPSFNGQKALELAKEICPTIPFIFISGTIGEDRAVELLKQGATDYVLKDRMERLAFATKRALDAAVHLNKFRQTEIELQTNRKLLQTIINNAIDLIYVKNIQGKYLLINDAFEKSIGKTAQEVVGKDDTFIFSASEAQMTMDIDKKVIESSASFTYEESFKLIDGNYHYFQTIKSPMFDDYGNLTGLFGIARDITDRKQIETALHDSEEIFKNFMEHSPIYVFFKDENIRALRLSKNYEAMLGKPMAELLGKNMDDLFPSDIAKSMVADDMKILIEGKEIVVEEELNGRYYTTIKFPIEIDGKQRYLAGYTIDITERKQAEETILKERTLFSTLIENLPVGVFVKDKEYKKIIVNPVHYKEVLGHLKNLGMNSDIDILGKTDFEVFPEELAKNFFNEDKKVIEDGSFVLNIEGEGYSEEGKQLWLQVSKIPLRDNNDKIIGMIGVATDITKIKQSEEAIKNKAIKLERFNDVMVGRELKMVDLKKEINGLLKRLGEKAKYQVGVEEEME